MYKTVLGISLICLLGLAHSSQGQSPEDLIEQLQSTDPDTRSQAFYQLQEFGYSSSEQIKVAIINLLTLENTYADSQTSLSEDYVTYYGDVTMAVAALNDVRALNALLGVIDSGDIAVKALAGFGTTALDPVIAELNSPQDTIKTAAVLVLDQMLEPPNFQLVNDPISISKIRAALVKASLDPNRFTSMSAVEGLAKIGGPPTAKCTDMVVPTDPGICSAASASVNNGSSDPDGDAITLHPSPAGPYGLGTTAVTLTVTDTEELSASCSANVTVVDRQPPAISCPAPVAECTSPNGAAVSFSPTASDNCPGLQTPNCVSASGSTFALGSTAFSCSVTDGSGNSNTCNSTVTVRDTRPPAIAAVSASPNVLWPPNNKLVPVSVSVSDSDTCDPKPVCKITQITSNEAITSADAQITGNLTANLRAQRLGSGTGRIYTLTVQCTDASGNSSTAGATVSVPHDQGK
jgi:hypothetical protein